MATDGHVAQFQAYFTDLFSQRFDHQLAHALPTFRVVMDGSIY
jgi:hypothetical protein